VRRLFGIVLALSFPLLLLSAGLASQDLTSVRVATWDLRSLPDQELADAGHGRSGSSTVSAPKAPVADVTVVFVSLAQSRQLPDCRPGAVGGRLCAAVHELTGHPVYVVSDKADPGDYLRSMYPGQFPLTKGSGANVIRPSTGTGFRGVYGLLVVLAVVLAVVLGVRIGQTQSAAHPRRGPHWEFLPGPTPPSVGDSTPDTGARPADSAGQHADQAVRGPIGDPDRGTQPAGETGAADPPAVVDVRELGCPRAAAPPGSPAADCHLVFAPGSTATALTHLDASGGYVGAAGAVSWAVWPDAVRGTVVLPGAPLLVLTPSGTDGRVLVRPAPDIPLTSTVALEEGTDSER
jgi:hypothetical protein